MPRDSQRRIVAKIESLAENPRPHGAIKLVGEDCYRVRVGDYRIIYAIADEKLVVIIVEIGHRREIYRGL
jgi:mRNA interferase RelE/StbE